MMLRCLLLILVGACAPVTTHAQSQGEMNQLAFADYKTADKKLNKIYPQVLAKLDAEGQEKLKAAQRAWVAFRDAQAAFDADLTRGGSMSPMLHANSLTNTTEERIRQLQSLLKELNDR